MMTGPDRPQEEPPADSTQVLPPGSFGRAVAENPVPAGDDRTEAAPPAAASSSWNPPEDFWSATPAAQEPDPDHTQYLPPVGPDWNRPADSGPAPAAGPSLPPTVPPPYAPGPAPYQPALPGAAPQVITPPPAAVAPAPEGSRATAGWVSLLLGLLFSLGGLFLLVRFGFHTLWTEATVTNLVLAGVGVGLLFATALLSIWSGWATLIPGLLFAALGGLLFFDRTERTWSWLYDAVGFAIEPSMVGALIVNASLLVTGLLLLATSLVAFLSRRAGRRSAAPVSEAALSAER